MMTLMSRTEPFRALAKKSLNSVVAERTKNIVIRFSNQSRCWIAQWLTRKGSNLAG